MNVPELAIGAGGVDHLITELHVQSGDLLLVVAGSYYKNASPPYFNYAPILAKGSDNSWKEITGYSKLIPFSAPPSAFHGLNFPDDTTVAVEDIIPGTGIVILPAKDAIIGVAICRDAMDLLSAQNPIHGYVDFIDLLLVISDNTGNSNMFSGVAECLARWHNCATLYTNSIVETKQGNKYLEMSFCIYPFKGGSSTTSVSGILTYDTSPFPEQQANTDFFKVGAVGILASSGITYESVASDERENLCKVYAIKCCG
jgi:hypothetical protein